MGFNLLAMTLDMILYITLHRAIGLNLSGELASSTLGIRARKVEFIDLRIGQERLESSTTSHISVLTKLQRLYKN